MNKINHFKIFILISGLLLAQSVFGQVASFGSHSNADLLRKGQSFHEGSRASFEENKGQVTGIDAQNVKFIYKTKGLSVFLMNNGIAYQFSKTHYPEGYKRPDKFSDYQEIEEMRALSEKIQAETYRMDVTLVGADLNAKISTEEKSKDYAQYYNHDALNVYSYSKVTYHDVYPNIDWVIYKTETGLKYDFIVHPGGDPARIKLQTNWVEDLTLNKDGSLSFKNILGEITEQKPVSFQGEEVIETHFKVKNNIFYFEISEYNSSIPLVIDPTLIWATYYGDSGSDRGNSCVVDGSGNVYMAGSTASASSIASGGYQNIYGGASFVIGDPFLVKFNSSGVRQWSTYYGGSSDDGALSCAVDISGNVYLSGYTLAASGISSGGFQNSYGGGQDAFLVKFNSAGLRQWGTYYGGSDYEYGSYCSVDGSGNVYLAGQTASTSGISSGGHQNTMGDINDSFLVKFNSAGARQWGTYYGGIGSDLPYYCAADVSGNVYLLGSSESTSGIASGGFQNSNAGGVDAYLVKFNSLGVRQWGTYYGGSGSDVAYSCAVDGSGNVYLTGNTTSASGIASGGHQNVYAGSSIFYGDAFLVKFNSAGLRQWGTYYGGSDDDRGGSCAVDGSGNIYLLGDTYSTSGISSGGYQNVLGGGGDAFLVKFNDLGVRQWGTYFGGVDEEYGASCALDGSGNVYFTGFTRSSSGIASSGHQNILGGGMDAFLVKFADCLPETNTTSTATICETSTKALTSSGPGVGTWSIVSGGGTISGTTYTPADISSNTVVTVRYVDGCGTGTNVAFTVNSDLGTASNTTSAAAICEGDTKALTGSPAGGAWSIVSGGGTISGTTYTSPTISSNTTVTVRYTISANGACLATTSDVAFTVNDNLGTASNSTSAAAICEGSTKALTATPTGGTWSVVSGGGTISGTTYTSPSISSNTTVTVRYTIAANGACPATTSDVAFTVNDNLGTATNTTSTTAICEGSTKALTATPAGGTWIVVSGGGTISGTTYNSPVISSDATVVIRYTIATNGACPGSTSDVSFTVNDNLGIANNTTSTAAICEGNTKALTGTPAGGTWSVVSGGGTISGTTYTSPSISSNTTVTVRYTIAANGACPATTSDLAFTVNDNLGTASNSTSTAAICEGDTKALTASPAGGTWSVVSGGGSISGTTYTSPVISSNTTVTVRYTIATNGACPGSTSDVAFTVNDNLGTASNTTSTAAICEGSTKALTGTPAGGTWSVVSGGGSISGTTYTSPVISSNTTVTVRYTIAANGACPATTSDVAFTVNDNLGTASNTTSTASICEGSTKTLIATPAGGTWSVISGGGTISGTTYTSPVISSDATVTVRYTVAANGACPATTSDVAFTVNDNLGTANNTTSATAICEGSTKALTATPAGGTWSVFSGGGTITGTTYTSPVISSDATVTVRYAVAANGACPATTSDVVFTVNDNLGTANNTTSATAICEGSTKALTATPAGGSWSVTAGGGTISGTTYTSPAVSSNTNVTVRYSIAANGACPASTSDVTFTVNDNPGAPSNTTSTASICEGDTKALTASPAGGSWSVVSGGGTITGTTYTSPSVSSNTTVTVGYTIPPNGSCPALTADVIFTVNDNLGVPSNNTSIAAICEGSTKPLTASPAGGSWSVLSGGGSISGTTYTSPAVSSNTTVTVAYTIAANGACPAASSNVSFDVNDNIGAAVNTTSNTSICENDSKTLVGSPAGGTWTIISGGGAISGTNYTNTPISSNSVVTIQYAMPVNGACPASTDDVVFTVFDNVGPVVINTSNTSICAGDTKVLDATPAGGVWSITSGSGTISGSNYNSNGALSATETIALTYTLTNGACSISGNLSFTVNPIPGTPAIASVSADSICVGQNTTLTATNSGSGTLAWYPSNVPSGAPLNSGSTFNVSPTVTTTYYVFGNSSGACYSGSYDSTIIVVSAPSVAAALITASSSSVCSGETVTLAVNGGSLAAGADWFWYSGSCGTTLVGQGNSITVSPTANTTYFVRAEGGTCGSSSCNSVAISIQNSVSASFAIPSLICVTTTSVDLNQYLSSSATTGGTWSGVSLTSGSVINPSTLGVGTFTVKYKVGTSPCVDSLSQTFSIVAPSASLNAQNDSYVILESQAGLFSVTTNDLPSTLMITSIGSPVNGTASIVGNQISYTSNIDFRGLDSMTYSACDSICVSSCSNAIVYIQVDSDVIDGGNGHDGNGNVGGWILTPNGDGKDDVFYIDGLYEYQKNEIVIFNRWGDEIYSASPYKNDWNSTSPKDVVSGTYFFILKLTLMDNTEKVVKGFIHIEK